MASTGRLYILAFDHRGSFRKGVLGISGREPTPEENVTIEDAKYLIWEGVQKAIDAGVPRESAGVLVDEQYGTRVARDASQAGVQLAMPVETSGQDIFDFEYGDDYGSHIEDFDPAYSKVLVRFNPDDSAEDKRIQIERLSQLGVWLRERGRKYLFELLVPGSESQLGSVAADTDRYDREVRPRLMLQCVQELQDGGVEPDIWKIEGLDRREDCEEIAKAIRAGGRDDVTAVVLGRGADDAAVDHWLRQGAAVDGYIGFAIGRSIWNDPLKSFVTGGLERDAAAAAIANNYRRFIDVYEEAAG